MIKVILFDFFGVFCPDLYWVWLRSEGFALEDCDGFEVPVREFDLAHINRTQFYQQIADKTGFTPQAVEEGMSKEMRPNKRLTELARTLRKDYEVGLLSNSDGAFLREILEQAKLYDCFDQILISSETGFRKPDPQAFQNALTLFQAKAEECIFIDDRSYNVEAAEALGIVGLPYKNNQQVIADLLTLNLL